MEGKKQNQLENYEVNEYNIMPLQNNMIKSAVEHTDQPSNKKRDQQRRIWSGKLDSTFSSNSILETIEENDNNLHQPSVLLANFGNLNKEFELFEWDLIREEDPTVVTEFINNKNTEHHFSPPFSIPFRIWETPKKVLRERVNNYKRMFETSLKENNELREFTTLEKQMFYDNSEQLKELSNLRKQVDNLQIEKNESEKMMKKLKYSIQVVENEKYDIEIQRNQFEKRENELLAIIQEIKKELKSKEDQIKNSILNDNFLANKQEEIIRHEMKIKEMYQLNKTCTNEIEILKLQLLNKDQQLNVELSERCSLLNELSLLQSYTAKVKSVPCAIQFLADEGYFSLTKCKISELVQLLEHIHNTVEQLEQKNLNLIDENNNLKLINNDFNIQINNTKKENNELKLKLNSIEEKIVFTIKEFSGSSEINIDNFDMDNLIEFVLNDFKENTNKNLILKEKLSISNKKLCEIISFVFNNLDYILQSISTIEDRSSTEMEKFKKELPKIKEENIHLKSSIQALDKITIECANIIEQIKINQPNILYFQEELIFCNGVKNVLQLQIVLVDSNKEFDLMKSELPKKTVNEQMLLKEKVNLELNLVKLGEHLINVTKEMELKEENTEDLVSIINVLVIEIKEANSVKQNLISCLNEAEHELLKSGDLCESLKLELYSVQKELENACIKTECIKTELQNLEFKLNNKINKKYFDGCNVSNQLIDPLVDYVHDIKLKLTELNSAMISGNQSEKQFRTKVMLVNDDVLRHEDTWKISCDSQPESPNSVIGLEIDNLHKILKEKNELINTLQTAKNETEKNISELQCQMKNDLQEQTLLVSNLNNELNRVQQLYIKLKEQINEPQEHIIKLSDENEKLSSNLTLIENNLKDKISLECILKNELNNLKIENTKLLELNQSNKNQIDFSYDIDLELRNGKKNIMNEINLLEPGQIMGILTDHNLSNLFDTFVSLIITKEHQIVTDLVSDHSKIKQLYEDKINQMQEDLKKVKKWKEHVETDNEKLILELENLKIQKHSFSSKELEIKELTEKILEAENQSFNYLSELEELKTQLSKTGEQHYQSLSHEFDVFKTCSEQSIQDLKNKLENLTKQYEKTLNTCEVQKVNYLSQEVLIEKIQSECAFLKSVIEKKDEDIKNLLEGFKLKTNENETMIEQNSLQKEEMRILHEKKINDLQFDLSNMKHEMYCTEKLLKEINKKYKNDQIELKMNDNSLFEVNNIIEKLRKILKCDGTLPTIYKNISSLTTKCECLEKEIKELKHANVNLDNECESMLDEVNNKNNKITELLTQVDLLKQNTELLTDERDVLRNKCKQLKIFNNDIKKLNNEICGYEQNIYELRKDKGQLIVQHSKELKQLQNELQEVQTKNLELFNEYSSLSETAKNLEKSLKEDIQQLNRCIVDKNVKISTLELFSKNYSDDLKKKNHDLEIVFKRARDESHMLRRELRRLKKITNVSRAEQCTQTTEEQTLVISAMDQKCMIDRIAKFESDSKMMRMMLRHRKSKIEELEKQLNERHYKI